MKEFEITSVEEIHYTNIVRGKNRQEAIKNFTAGKIISKDESKKYNNMIDVEFIKDIPGNEDIIIRKPIKVSNDLTLKPGEVHDDFEYIGFYIDNDSNHKYILRCNICGAVKEYRYATLKGWWIYKHASGTNKPVCRKCKTITPPDEILKEVEKF